MAYSSRLSVYIYVYVYLCVFLCVSIIIVKLIVLYILKQKNFIAKMSDDVQKVTKVFYKKGVFYQTLFIISSDHMLIDLIVVTA